jgi:hypothetical protein
MTQSAVNLDELVDPETGEILDVPFADPADKITVEDLPRVARSLRTLAQRMGEILEFRRAETERIAAHCDRKVERAQQSHDYLLGIARTLMASTEERRLEYPGLGVLKFGTTRESVNTEGYDALTPEEKEELHAEFPGLFRIKTTVSPDKKEIMATSKAGVLPTPGFTTNPKQETFTFKAEL